MNKQFLLDQLYAPYRKCLKCPLGSQGRTRVVFGAGDPNATIFFIGEGPGAQEDAQGTPFVGKSGQLLSKTLEAVGIDRTKVFITNIVKCRPPENRKPFLYEANTCKNLLLLKQIQIVQPKIICTLGATALEGLLDKKMSITKKRGQYAYFNGIILLPTYHPAYILRNPKALESFIFDLALVEKESQIE